MPEAWEVTNARENIIRHQAERKSQGSTGKIKRYEAQGRNHKEARFKKS